ncbi:MAG: hypothetical protein IBX63_01310 [Coriobacteriia bacterium]|nr:hypothetical protein [Coriobacteriia bacterium]
MRSRCVTIQIPGYSFGAGRTHKAHTNDAYVFGGPFSIIESVRTAIANALK